MRTPTSATGSARPAAGAPSRGRTARRRGAREGGFTLLELLAVIAILAIVLGTSAPAMQRLYQSAQYRGAVSDVVSSLNAARIEAIQRGAYRDVLIDPRARRIVRDGKVQSLPQALELEVLGSRELNRDGAGVIRFYPDGGSSGGHVRLSHANGMAVEVRVDWLLGRVTLCREDCAREA